MSFDVSGQLSQHDILRSDLTQLRSSGDAIQTDLDAVVDAKGAASACHKVWMHIETCTLFLHNLVLEEDLTSDARAVDPLDAMRTYLGGAEAQVKGVMSEEYEVDIAKKRLTMAMALADTTLEQVSSYMDELSSRLQTRVNSPGWRG
jgi:hypothetical protein